MYHPIIWTFGLLTHWDTFLKKSISFPFCFDGKCHPVKNRLAGKEPWETMEKAWQTYPVLFSSPNKYSISYLVQRSQANTGTYALRHGESWCYWSTSKILISYILIAISNIAIQTYNVPGRNIPYADTVTHIFWNQSCILMFSSASIH